MLLWDLTHTNITLTCKRTQSHNSSPSPQGQRNVSSPTKAMHKPWLAMSCAGAPRGPRQQLSQLCIQILLLSNHIFFPPLAESVGDEEIFEN